MKELIGKTIDFRQAYYIKLGREGRWEKDSTETGKIRLGWDIVDLENILNNKWETIRKTLLKKLKKKGRATTSLNALKKIYDAGDETVFITFYDSKLYWCKAKNSSPKNRIMADEISKYRTVDGSWNDRDIMGDTVFWVNQIPGKIAQLQRFAGTLCNVNAVDTLKRLINGEPSTEYNSIVQLKDELVSKVESGIKLLHWKDFEVLVDLVFRQAGWRRISMVGEGMKYTDLDLQEPITGDRYQVQIKSKASLKDFNQYCKGFNNEGFKKLFFVVHSPDKSLIKYGHGGSANVELVLSERLAEMVFDGGLVKWLADKIR